MELNDYLDILNVNILNVALHCHSVFEFWFFWANNSLLYKIINNFVNFGSADCLLIQLTRALGSSPTHSLKHVAHNTDYLENVFIKTILRNPGKVNIRS